MVRLFAGLDPTVPSIHFGTGTSTLLELQRDAGGTVIGLDWRIDLRDGWERLGPSVAVQGNLDPTVLFAPFEEVERQALRILERAGGRPRSYLQPGPRDHAPYPGRPRPPAGRPGPRAFPKRVLTTGHESAVLAWLDRTREAV